MPQPRLGDVPIILAQRICGSRRLSKTAKSSVATAATISGAILYAEGNLFSRAEMSSAEPSALLPIASVPSIRLVRGGFDFCSSRKVGAMKLWANITNVESVVWHLAQ